MILFLLLHQIIPQGLSHLPVTEIEKMTPAQNLKDGPTACKTAFSIAITQSLFTLKALSHYNVLANVCRRMKYVSSTLAYAEN